MNRQIWITLFLFGCTLVPHANSFADEKSRTWEGTWNNRKYGTSGPLKCVAKEIKPGTWEGVFTGKFQGDPFKYTAKFEAKPTKGDSASLAGKATIRGHRYQWTGSMNGGGLKGKYQSSVGYHGEFILKTAR